MVDLPVAHDWFVASCKATPAQRAAVARLVRCQHFYATAPFTMMTSAAGWRLAANLSPPPPFDAAAMSSWMPDGDIVQIDPLTGSATLVGDEGGWIVGELPHDRVVTLYTDGLAFVRAWAASRLAMIEQHKRGNVPGLMLRDRSDHGLPGLLLAGSHHTVCDWSPLLEHDRVRVDDPGMVQPLARALLRAKRVPIVEALACRSRNAA